jgi:DNA-binding ferritin-like protein
MYDKHFEAQVELVDAIAERIHTHVIKPCRASASKAGDSGTADLLVPQVVRTNEPQAWFLSEHLVAASLVRMARNDRDDPKHRVL